MMKRNHPSEDINGENSGNENDLISKKIELNDKNESFRIVNDKYNENSVEKKKSEDNRQTQNQEQDQTVNRTVEIQQSKDAKQNGGKTLTDEYKNENDIERLQDQDSSSQKDINKSNGHKNKRRQQQDTKQPQQSFDSAEENHNSNHNESNQQSQEQQQFLQNKQQNNDHTTTNMSITQNKNNNQAQDQIQKSNGTEEEQVNNSQSQDSSHLDALKMQYLNEKNLKKLVDLCKNYKDIYKEYQKLKYKNKIYGINDLVLIQNADDLHNDFIGYYKKSDLPKKFDNILDCISDNEIFETDHLDITFVDCINGPCKLYSYQEFDNLSSISQNAFYTRAKYDTAHKRLVPAFENWEKGCICRRPLNPDHLYIQCEICEKWFHITCIGISEKVVDKIDHYKCPNCLQEKADQKQLAQNAGKEKEQ